MNQFTFISERDYMKKIFNEIKNLSNKLMFNLKDDELKYIVAEYEDLQKQLDLLASANVENVWPINFLYEDEQVYLREDEIVSDVQKNNQQILEDNKLFDKKFLVVKHEK